MISDFKKIKINNITTAGLVIKITRSQSKNYELIRKLWKTFNRQLYKIKKHKYNKNWLKFGITFKEKNNYYYLSGIKTNDIIFIPDNFLIKHIPQGEYACFTHTGSMYDIKKTIHKIYNDIKPKNNLNHLPMRKNLLHFELYDYRFNWNNPNSIINIFIPIE
jgi:AraC family transcriptional regulator